MKTFTRFLTPCRHTLTVAFVVSCLLASTTASAAIFTWSGGGANTSWSTTANWSGGTAPTTGNDLRFNNSTRTTNVNNIGSLSIGTITFASPAGAFTISGSAINLGSITNTSANTQTLSLGVIQSTSGTYDASSNITLSGSLSGSGNISKTGAGTLALNGASKSGYTGTVTVNDGTLSIGTAGMSNANVNMQANTTLATPIAGNLNLKSLEISGANVTLPSNTLAFVGGGLTNSTGSQLTIANNVTFSGSTTINAGANGMVLSGAVGGSGTTSSIGSGLLDLTNSSNGFFGQFNVNSGTTRVSAGMAGAAFFVANGAVLESTLGGVGAVESITLQNGAALLPGEAGSIGSFTANTDVTLAPTSTVAFDIAGLNPGLRGAGGTEYDQVNFAAGYSSGVLTYDGYLDLNFATSTTFDNGMSFLLFNPGDVGTFSGDLVGINPTTTTASSPYDGLSFTNYSSLSSGEQAFLSSYYLNTFGVEVGTGDWISDWNSGNQRLIFSQSTGTLTVVPEPSTIVFAGIGVAMFGWSTWTRRRAKARRQGIEAAIA